jgi:hypothetical protein
VGLCPLDDTCPGVLYCRQHQHFRNFISFLSLTNAACPPRSRAVFVPFSTIVHPPMLITLQLNQSSLRTTLTTSRQVSDSLNWKPSHACPCDLHDLPPRVATSADGLPQEVICSSRCRCDNAFVHCITNAFMLLARRSSELTSPMRTPFSRLLAHGLGSSR